MISLDIKRIKIMFHINRPHLTYDILTILRNYDISVISMEVYSNVIYLKVPYISEDMIESIRRECEKVYGYDYMEEIDVMSFEEKDIELKGVLNLIGEGVIMLSSKGVVEYGNKIVFKHIENLEVGKYIFEFIDDVDLKNYIERKENNFMDKSIRNKNINISNYRFLLNVDRLYSEDGIFCGYLLTLKEINGDFSYDSLLTFEDIIGEDENFKRIVDIAKLYAYSDASILLTGESGTGKEMFARAIHSESNRASKPFVGINCAAIPEELLESELFGYEPGSFTGANKTGKRGIFETANGGTVFLDEIGEMNYHLQAKLLRVLQEKKIRPIGSDREISLDVRIISATNRNLEKLIEDGNFRMDLFYRLNIFRIEIPPLRNRVEDIPLLTQYFLNVLSHRYSKGNIQIDESARQRLNSYNWPGNIREMQNVLERAVVLSREGPITEEHITFDKTDSFDNLILNYEDLNSAVGTFEREFILKALRENKTIRATAKVLNVTHTLLLNRIKKYKIQDDEWRV
ncbi:sigma-54 interaction domain-containing protein [Peptoniphilus mikwangii]|uniref:sigma-54 interaction domain-containing protein n=1 Tax=Peptoniphilus mikwangii TaxID=1354300 RepID=UPI00190F977B|nr:sigma 54-interacting transcriptional regulator [Peptoniphilus mikwangii]